MSNWTDEKHELARQAATDGDEGAEGATGWAVAYLSDALDEIERLRAESARRMVWLENEQKAHEQTRAALIDMTERATHPEVTDGMVERAAEALTTAMHATCENGWMSGRLSDYTIDGHYNMLTATRAALVAALTPGEGQ